MKRKAILKDLREKFDLPGVDYSEKRKNCQHVKWYYIRIPMESFNLIKEYAEAKYPSIKVIANNNPSWWDRTYTLRKKAVKSPNVCRSLVIDFPFGAYE